MRVDLRVGIFCALLLKYWVPSQPHHPRLRHNPPPFPGVQICVFLFYIFFLFILTCRRLEKIIEVISCLFLLVLLITYLQKNVFKYTRAKKRFKQFLDEILTYSFFTYPIFE
jgi:hypothetical protein